MFPYARFTDRARKVMQLANQEAQRFNHEYIGTEHILLGLVKEGSGVAANVLKSLGIDLPKVRREIEKIILRGPEMVTMGKLPLTPRVKKVLEYATEEARNIKCDYIGTEHLLLGLLRDRETVAAQILLKFGLNFAHVRKEVLRILGKDAIMEESNLAQSTGRAEPPTEAERIHSLEQQLWNVRLLLGAMVGTLAGALLAAEMGAVLGLLIGGGLAVIGWRILGAAAGGVAGAVLGYTYLSNLGGSLPGVLLGGLIGYLISETGGSSERRGCSFRCCRRRECSFRYCRNARTS